MRREYRTVINMLIVILAILLFPGWAGAQCSSIAFSDVSNINSGNNPDGMMSADFNGDGIADMIAVEALSPDQDTISMMLGLGGGRFSAPITIAGSNGGNPFLG